MQSRLAVAGGTLAVIGGAMLMQALTARRSGQQTRVYRLLLCGFGSVNKAFLKMLADKRNELRSEHGLEFVVAGIITGSHGYIVSRTREGLDIAKALACAESGGSVENLLDPSQKGAFKSGSAVDNDVVEQSIGWSNADVLFEAIPVNYSTGQPATRYCPALFSFSCHKHFFLLGTLQKRSDVECTPSPPTKARLYTPTMNCRL
jgi:hypothetical protein